jgi:hypothetical protein
MASHVDSRGTQRWAKSRNAVSASTAVPLAVASEGYRSGRHWYDPLTHYFLS